MKSARVLIGVCVVLAFTSCDKESSTTGGSIVVIDFLPGQRWTYDVSFTAQDTAGALLSSARDSFEVWVAALQDSVLGQTGLVRLEARSFFGMTRSVSDTERVWYSATDSSLTEVAYQGPTGFPVMVKRWGAGLQHDVWSLFDPLASFTRSLDGPPQLREDPRLVYVYPLTIGAEWMSFAYPFPQSRRVEEYGSLSLPFDTFMTLRIRTTSSFGGDPIIFDDWVSNEGLVKRRLEFNGYYVDANDPTAEIMTHVINESVLTSVTH